MSIHKNDLTLSETKMTKKEKHIFVRYATMFLILG